MVVFAFGSKPNQDVSQNLDSKFPEAHKLPTRHFDEKPPMTLEIETTGDHAGRMLITNLYQEALTAFAIDTVREAHKGLPPNPRLRRFGPQSVNQQYSPRANVRWISAVWKRDTHADRQDRRGDLGRWQYLWIQGRPGTDSRGAPRYARRLRSTSLDPAGCGEELDKQPVH